MHSDLLLLASSGQAAPVGQAAETDAALGLTPVPTRRLGLATETDTAWSIVPIKRRAIGLAVETDLAQTVTLRHFSQQALWEPVWLVEVEA